MSENIEKMSKTSGNVHIWEHETGNFVQKDSKNKQKLISCFIIKPPDQIKNTFANLSSFSEISDNLTFQTATYSKSSCSFEPWSGMLTLTRGAFNVISEHVKLICNTCLSNSQRSDDYSSPHKQDVLHPCSEYGSVGTFRRNSLTS